MSRAHTVLDGDPLPRDSRRTTRFATVTRLMLAALSADRAPAAAWSGRRILFVSSTRGSSPRYRCTYRAEELELAGARTAVARSKEIDPERACREYDVIVLHRAGWTSRIARLLGCARSRRVPVVYDTDDLVFDPAVADLVPGIREERRSPKLAGRLRALMASDAVTTSTEPLADRARALGRPVAVLPNVVGEEMVRGADAALAADVRHGDVTIAYFSGTPHHDVDFLEAADAVLAVLDRVPRTRLLLVGPISVDGRFDRFGARVERVGHRAYGQLPALLARTDINLAPLEPDNPFTEAKSAIKYFEAGLMAVPTVASATPDFRRVISDGVNGFLAPDRDTFRERLLSLVEDESLRLSIGVRASVDVRRGHTTRACADEHSQRLRRLVEATRPSRIDAARSLVQRVVKQ